MSPVNPKGSTQSESTPVFHPVYSSMLATLPDNKPIPITEILSAYSSHDRQLATTFLVATTWSTIETALTLLPWAEMRGALALLAETEQDRIIQLLVTHLKSAKAARDLTRCQSLSPAVKQKAWACLTPAEKVHIRHLLTQGGTK